MTTPYKALQQATKWLDQQEACQLLNISKRTLQTYRAKGILGATQINRKTYFRLSEVELLMQGERPLKSKRNETDWKFKRRYACLARSCGRHQNELLYIREYFHPLLKGKSTFRANRFARCCISANGRCNSTEMTD